MSESLSLKLREKHGLRVSESRVMRMFGPKRDQVIGDLRKPHNEELHNLYSWSSIFRMIKSSRMRWAEHVADIGEKRSVYKILAGRPGGKRPLARGG
jgi:hypothetical protein